MAFLHKFWPWIRLGRIASTYLSISRIQQILSNLKAKYWETLVISYHYLHVNNFPFLFKLFLFIKKCIKILKDARVFVHFISCWFFSSKPSEWVKKSDEYLTTAWLFNYCLTSSRVLWSKQGQVLDLNGRHWKQQNDMVMRLPEIAQEVDI